MMSKKGRHKTIAKELKQSVAWLESLVEVRRVIIGISESCRHRYSPGTLRVRLEVLGGLSVNGYSGKGVTDIYLQIDEDRINDVMRLIQDRFS